MKKVFVILSFCIISIFLNKSNVSATDQFDYTDLENPQPIRCTVYTSSPNALTSSGRVVHEGVIAGKKEWQGLTAALYTVDGEFIGYYEILDTGFGIDTDKDGVGSIQEGTSIDVWCEDLNACNEFVSEYGDYVLMVLIKAEG